MKVLLIDDHPLILSAMQSVILGLGANVEAIGVETAAECRELLRRDSDFDLVLLDLHLDDASGFDVLGELRMGYPALPVVVVSASDRAGDMIRAIDSGAMGFVPKRASNELLFEALHLVMSGGIYVPPMTLNLGDTTLPMALSNGLSSPGAGALSGGLPRRRPAIVRTPPCRFAAPCQRGRRARRNARTPGPHAAAARGADAAAGRQVEQDHRA